MRLQRVGAVRPGIGGGLEWKNRERSKGFGTLDWLLAIPALFLILLILAIGFYEGRKVYWDSKVEEMCAKEGGIKIYERVSIPPRYLEGDKNIRIPSANVDPTRKPFEWEAKSDDLFYYVKNHKEIVSGNLSVGRDDIQIIRAADKKVLGELAVFGRSGGDFPTFAHPSSFRCPAHQNLEEAVFIRPQLPR